MKCLGLSLMRRFLKNECGQTAVVVMLTAGAMMALSGATVETGHIYYAYQQLVASTNAAAMAGAQAMPNTTLATSNVALYSAQSGQLNANPMLRNAVATPTFLCLGGVNKSFNVACETSTGASGGYNALSVTQTAKVNLWFGGLVGHAQHEYVGDGGGSDAGRDKLAMEYCDHPGHDGVDGQFGWRRAMFGFARDLCTAGAADSVAGFVSLCAGADVH